MSIFDNPLNTSNPLDNEFTDLLNRAGYSVLNFFGLTTTRDANIMADYNKQMNAINTAMQARYNNNAMQYQKALDVFDREYNDLNSYYTNSRQKVLQPELTIDNSKSKVEARLNDLDADYERQLNDLFDYKAKVTDTYNNNQSRLSKMEDSLKNAAETEYAKQQGRLFQR